METVASNENSIANTTAVVLTTYRRRDILSDLVSDEEFTILFLFWPSVRVFIVFPGLWANVINMRTFFRMGLNDNATISFFALAVIDFVTLFIGAVILVLNVLMYLSDTGAVFFIVHPTVINITLSAFGSAFNVMATFQTLVLAVQRCLCIIRPLRFRDTFSKSFTWKMIAFIVFICLAGNMVYVMSWRAVPFFNPFTNRTQYVIWAVPKLSRYLRKEHVFVSYFLIPIVCEVIILWCVIVMAKKLKASVKFRQSAAARKDGSETTTAKDSSTDKAPSKERNAITQVTLICVIFLVANFPKLVVSSLGNFLPGYELGGRYSNFSRVLANLRITVDYMNAAINFLVYYKYNTKFRNLCFRDVKKT